MKLLIITYSYTPDLTPRAFRWSAVASQLVQKGHQVHVLCAALPGADVAMDSDGVTVYRVRDWLLNASARVTPGAGTAGSAEVGGSRFLHAVLRKTIRAIWRSTHWPDYACGWIIPATRTARALCKVSHYDWIISVSHPFTGHVVGMLAKSCSPRSRWLVDIGDPYSHMNEPSPNNRHVYSWLNRTIEGRVVADADAISVTTVSTRHLYGATFPRSIGKLHVIPPLLSLPELPSPPERKSDGTIRLVFVGTLYQKLRSPKFLLACIAALSQALPERRIELHFYGNINDCGGEFLSLPESMKSLVLVHGMVSRERVVQAMVDADVLINIGNNSESQLASKVVEYMAVGKPILNFTSISLDTSLDALVDYPATLNIERAGNVPRSEVVEAMRSFVLNSAPVDKRAVERVRRRYSGEHVAGLYESLLNQMVPQQWA
ncbi:MAG: glycosyltransferase [Rhodocyclaceae bacterium]|nr:glycosyltransferase [Rhodocyclaceae bacterium]MDZ4214824.1 glycosyltransferase [Rhodocyclaceae bacterium]